MERSRVARLVQMFAIGVVAAVAIVGCGSGDEPVADADGLVDDGGSLPADPGRAVEELVEVLADLGATSLSSALEDIDVSALTDSDEFTFLAPDDAAFRTLGADELVDLLADQDVLTDLLRDHLVPERLTEDDLRARESVTSELGTVHPVQVEGDRITVGGATVVGSPAIDGPGIVHLVDGFLG